jgi:hypothetical protein
MPMVITMRSSTLRNLTTILILALLLAPEALFLHGCACGRIFDCCCRAKVKVGESCHLQHGGSHCEGGSHSLPASLQSRHDPVDRPGVSSRRRLEIRLALAGWTSEEPQGAVAALVPAPPVPPPRFL